MQLTQKETSLLKELKGAEELCIQKYNKAANDAKDPQLKQLFTHLSNNEQSHLNTIMSLQNGECPQYDTDNNAQMPTFTATYDSTETDDKKNDCFLCTDLLTAEKHASKLYDTSIFEFTDDCARDALNLIQSQEQIHGKMIFDYMNTNGMYDVQ